MSSAKLGLEITRSREYGVETNATLCNIFDDGKYFANYDAGRNEFVVYNLFNGKRR
jgi:hypothetical protein